MQNMQECPRKMSSSFFIENKAWGLHQRHLLIKTFTTASILKQNVTNPWNHCICQTRRSWQSERELEVECVLASKGKTGATNMACTCFHLDDEPSDTVWRPSVQQRQKLQQCGATCD